jgi:hypothetical protein
MENQPVSVSVTSRVIKIPAESKKGENNNGTNNGR